MVIVTDRFERTQLRRFEVLVGRMTFPVEVIFKDGVNYKSIFGAYLHVREQNVVKRIVTHFSQLQIILGTFEYS